MQLKRPICSLCVPFRKSWWMDERLLTLASPTSSSPGYESYPPVKRVHSSDYSFRPSPRMPCLRIAAVKSTTNAPHLEEAETCYHRFIFPRYLIIYVKLFNMRSFRLHAG